MFELLTNLVNNLSCLVIQKAHTYLNKPAAETSRFVSVYVTFLLPQGIEGLKSKSKRKRQLVCRFTRDNLCKWIDLILVRAALAFNGLKICENNSQLDSKGSIFVSCLKKAFLKKSFFENKKVELYSEPNQTSTMEYFQQNLHFGCLTGFWMHV